MSKIGENVEFKFCNPKKVLPCAKPRHISHRALKSVQSFFLYRTASKKEKERNGKGRKGTKSHANVIFHLSVGKPPVNVFSPNFAPQELCCTFIICADFGVEKLRDLENTRSQILKFPIKMAGHPYNSAALPRSLC